MRRFFYPISPRPLAGEGVGATVLGRPRSGERQEKAQRHCERSEAIQTFVPLFSGLLRRFAPRNDGGALPLLSRKRVGWAKARSAVPTV